MKTKKNIKRKSLYTPHEIDQTMKMLDVIGATNETDRDLMEVARENGLVEVRGRIPMRIMLTSGFEVLQHAR